MAVFGQKFTEKFSAPHPAFRFPEVKLARDIIRVYGLDKALIFVEGFFQLNTPFLREAGYSFRIFNSQLSKLIMHGNNPYLARLSGKTRTNVEACAEAGRMLEELERRVNA